MQGDAERMNVGGGADRFTARFGSVNPYTSVVGRARTCRELPPSKFPAIR